MTPVRILLVSNGYGEMAILGTIARAIAEKDPQALLSHMPLVGRLGDDAWPPPVGPQTEMPSGGLVTYWNVGNIVRDLRAGLVGLSLRQFAFLRSQRGAYDAVVAVGDVYCAGAAMFFARLPTIFVATAKSQYVAPHSPFECAIAKRARIVFARDAPTAAALARHGVSAEYAGNVMMDGVARAEFALPVDADARRVAVMPGSRADAPANARAAARRLQRIAAQGGKRVQAFLALAPAVSTAQMLDAVASEGLKPVGTGSASGVLATAASDGVTMVFVRNGLGAVLRAAEIVLGQAGTGNEQAAGLGKPVVAAAAQGESPHSVGWYRMRQQKLLGDALLVVPADDRAYADEVLRLLADPRRMAAMAAAGRERMGAAGASAVVADAALALAKERAR